MNEIALSLICATKGRYDVLLRLLDSLSKQTCGDFEIIIVDQNADDLILPLITRFAHLRIKHIRLQTSGNTRARNIGIENAGGRWVGFPDDDCWYHEKFVEDLLGVVDANHAIDGIFTNWTDPSSSQTMFSFNDGEMKLAEAFHLASCICIFFSRKSIAKIKGFNEKFGLGENTIIKAGEEQELLLRMISKQAKILKSSNLQVYHAIGTRPWNEYFIQRIISQGACDVYFHRKYIGYLSMLRLLITWFAGMMYNVLRYNKKNLMWYYYKVFGGVYYSFRIR